MLYFQFFCRLFPVRKKMCRYCRLWRKPCLLGYIFLWEQSWSYPDLLALAAVFQKLVVSFAQTVSAGEVPSGVFGFGVIWETCKNCCKTFTEGVPEAFFRTLFRVSTKRFASPLDLGWYGGVVICFIWKASQNSLKSGDVNCVPLSLTKQSTTLNRANSSWRKVMATPPVGLLHLRTSSHFV